MLQFASDAANVPTNSAAAARHDEGIEQYQADVGRDVDRAKTYLASTESIGKAVDWLVPEKNPQDEISLKANSADGQHLE